MSYRPAYPAPCFSLTKRTKSERQIRMETVLRPHPAPLDASSDLRKLRTPKERLRMLQGVFARSAASRLPLLQGRYHTAFDANDRLKLPTWEDARSGDGDE